MELPLDYVIQHLYTYCKRPIYKKNEGTYNAECCICNEGSSSGSKRRLFYFPSERYFYCFNCTRSWSELNWIQDVAGKSAVEILKDAGNFIPDAHTSKQLKCTVYTSESEKKDIPVIPEDSIDIFDESQYSFFKYTDTFSIVEKARCYCINRRLTTAKNKPKSMYISLADSVHANRLLIPFYSEANKIESYQSRALLEDVHPKYLTKYGEKCFYGENSIDCNIPYLFILEGPIDAMFIQNGIAIGGAKVTTRQNAFLAKHFDKKIVYIFDNDKNNSEMQKTVQRYIEQGKNIFIWPRELKQFKDVNEVCCKLGLDSISTDFILKNTFTGLEASVKFKTQLKL